MMGQKVVPSRAGGVEIVVEELSTRMAQEGHEITLLNRKRKHKKGETPVTEFVGCKVEEIFTINKKSLDALVYAYFATKKAARMAKKGEVDVVHVHAEGPCAFLSKFGKRGAHKNFKLVVTIHGLDWQRNKWGGFASSFLQHCERQAVKYADEIIVLSHNNKKYFKEKYDRDTVYIPNGVNIPTLRPADLITKEYGLKKDSYVLFLARLVPEKGAHYLIDAWRAVRKEIETDKKLVIAGGASHSDGYIQEIQEKCKDDESIIMTGFVEGQTLEELYSNAYLYVLPSDIEGMPMSLLEALSYGNVALVSDIPENTEVISEDCFVFEAGNVDRLRHQLKKIIKLNLTTHENMIQPYSWEEVVEKTLKLYGVNDESTNGQ